MRAILQDLRVAARSLAREPFFAALVIGILAVGIGVNTAMYSVVDRTILNPLPFDDPSRLARIQYLDERGRAQLYGLSDAEYVEAVMPLEPFESTAAYAYGGGTLTDTDLPEEPTSLSVTPRFFSTLGVRPLRGRLFEPDDFIGGADASRVVMLGEEIWRRRYQASEALVGGEIEIDSRTYTVIGLLPDSFRFPYESNPIQVFLPYRVDPERFGFSGWGTLSSFARLAPGASMEAADQQLRSISAGLASRYPDDAVARVFGAIPMSDEILGDETERSILLLWGAVGFVLLLACLNASNLLLARGAVRRRDVAICSALGAPRHRIMQRVLSESLLLALAAGLLGLLIAQWCIELLAEYASNLPRTYDLAIDQRAFAATLVMACLAGLAYGMIPAFQLSRVGVGEAMKEGGPRASTSRGGLRLRAALSVAQIAIAFSLLIGAGLMIRSSLELYSTDPGLEHERKLALTLWADVPGSSVDGSTAPAVQFYDEVLQQIRNVPGVESASLVHGIPWLSLFDWSVDFRLSGHPSFADGETARAPLRRVSETYFDDVGIPLLAGRQFGAADDADGESVVVVSETFASRYGGLDIVGEIVESGEDSMRVVGVVGDVRDLSLAEPPRPALYVPFRQNPLVQMTVVVGTERDAATMQLPVQQAIWKRYPTQGIWQTNTLESMLDSTLRLNNLYTTMLVIFAGIAVLLAAGGIYGVISYNVTQRTQEIGIRMALGATRGQVMRRVLRDAGRLALTGIGCGVVGGVSTALLLEGLLFGIPAIDLPTFVAVAAVLLSVALIACFLPARRATRIAPSICMRSI